MTGQEHVSTAEYGFADKNVLVDAAETVVRMWRDADRYLTRGRDDASLAAQLLSTIDDPFRAAEILRGPQLLLFNLANRVQSGAVAVGAVISLVNGMALEDVLASRPRPEWLVSFLGEHPDRRVSDLVSQGALAVSTTEVINRSKMILTYDRASSHGGSSDAVQVSTETADLLVDMLLAEAELFRPPFTTVQDAVRAGVLEPIRQEILARAPHHLADINLKDPYWRPRGPEPVRPPGVSSRDHKMQHPEYYGMDGDDLFLEYQRRYAEQQLTEMLETIHGKGHVARVRVDTSDYHAAIGLSLGQLAATRLYSGSNHGYVEPSEHRPGERPRRVSIRPQSREDVFREQQPVQSIGGASRPNPGMLRPNPGMLRPAGPRSR